VLGSIGHGHYMQPCVWDGVAPSMELFHKQVLGPTVNLVTVADIDEALACVHAAPCGLSASLYTEDRRCIERFRREARAEVLNLNTGGTGLRENGPWDLDWHTRWQTVHETAPGPIQAIPAHAAKGKPRPLTDWTGL
jgi:acyl-CoA reductase-like NAD-dependent aldehyde dehydrogenase